MKTANRRERSRFHDAVIHLKTSKAEGGAGGTMKESPDTLETLLNYDSQPTMPSYQSTATSINQAPIPLSSVPYSSSNRSSSFSLAAPLTAVLFCASAFARPDPSSTI